MSNRLSRGVEKQIREIATVHPTGNPIRSSLFSENTQSQNPNAVLAKFSKTKIHKNSNLPYNGSQKVMKIFNS